MTMRFDMNAWTVEETRELISRWPTRSAGQIATELHRSRSSVASKAKRLHLDGMHKHLDVAPRKRRLKPVPPPPPPAPPADSLAMQPCSLLELEAGRCHWPLGDVHQVAVLFCGGAAAPGRRYCQDHCRIARNG
jgi:GcrA cell cycle regulator